MTAAPANAKQTEGLTTLDRDRAASIADEGGTSAAAVETQESAKALPFPERDMSLDDTQPMLWRPPKQKLR